MAYFGLVDLTSEISIAVWKQKNVSTQNFPCPCRVKHKHQNAHALTNYRIFEGSVGVFSIHVSLDTHFQITHAVFRAGFKAKEQHTRCMREVFKHSNRG